ncbi:MAG: tRNA preQ1(34) S-adenosylmethionine ribosyltransferase-isomerase QueA [Desulfotalea sp.]
MNNDLSTKAYYYHLPEKNIAQRPADKRDKSQLMVIDAEKQSFQHKIFSDIEQYFRAGDVLVINDTEVFPARLTGNKDSGGKVEIFLLELPAIIKAGKAQAPALIKASRKPKEGSLLHISPKLKAKVINQLDRGKVELELIFDENENISEILAGIGDIPLPPYIRRDDGTSEEDRNRYQTVYATTPGAVAAPTAGLHFTKDLLTKLKDKGVIIAEVTLHVGYGTFAPVRVENIEEHIIHEEYVTVNKKCVEAIKEAKKNGKRIWAVGTTSVRSLEYAAKINSGKIGEVAGWCDLYIYPGFKFNVVDNVITNFHLPDSSLMFLVAALCSREQILSYYKEAITQDYRFFSYGDSMTIIRVP